MKLVRNVKVISMTLFSIVMSLVILAILQIPNLTTTYSIEQFFPKEHQLLAQDFQIGKIFSLDYSADIYVTLTLPASEKTWLTSSRMKQLSEWTQQASQWPGVAQTQSLSSVEMSLTEESTLKIGPIFETLPEERWQEYVDSHALIKPQLLSRDNTSTMLVISPTADTPKDIEQLRLSIIENFQRLAPELKVGVGGVSVAQTVFSERISLELKKFLGLCLLVFCLFFFFFYKNFSPVLLCLIGLLVVNITTLGGLAYFQVPFNVLLSTLPIVVSISFVSIAIHTLHLWADRLKENPGLRGTDRFYLSLKTLKEIAAPNFLGSLTTSIGFLVLVINPIPIIKTFATVIAVSVMWTWLISNIILAFIQPLVVPLQRDWTNQKALWILKITRWRMPLLFFLIGTAGFFTIQGRHVNFDGKLFDDLPKKDPVRFATEYIDRSFGGIVGYNITLVASTENSWKSPQQLKTLEQALEKIRLLPAVGSAISVSDFIGKIPENRQTVAETYFMFSLANQNPLNYFLSNDGKHLRVAIRFHDLASNTIDKARHEIKLMLQQHFPAMKIIETGLALNGHEINRDIAKELVWNFWHSLAVVGLLLIIIFRSVRWALAACIPNFLPPAILIGAMSLLGTTIKPGIALIFSIAMGLAFNNTMYLLSRLRRTQKTKNMLHLPLRRALLEEGNPCLSESALTLAGFLIFLASDFHMNQVFGAYMILSIFAGALGDLVFLPAFLRQFPGLLYSKKSEESPAPVTTTSLFLLLSLTSGLIAFFHPATTLAAATHSNEAYQILEKSRALLDSNSDSATVTLKIIEANGDIKKRELNLQTLRDKNTFRALARIQSPADVKGTSLLVEVKGGNEEQWLYLPSSKQVRRIVSGKKSAGVLGSELSPEDLNAEAIKGAQSRLLQKDAATATVEVTPKTGSSEYSKVLTQFSLSNYLPVKSEYYVGTKVKKTVEFLNYKTIDGKARAQLIRVKNLMNKRGTDVEFTNLKVNPKFSPQDFTPEALKD